MIVIQLFVVLWMPILAKGTVKIMFGHPECKEKIVTVSDPGTSYKYINSSCNCTINGTSRHEVIFKSEHCRTNIDLLNSTRAVIKTLCNDHISTTVTDNMVLFLIFKKFDGSMATSGNSSQNNIVIYSVPNQKGRFSVTCGATLGSTRRDESRPAIKNVSNDTSVHNVNTSKAGFQFASGSIVVVFAIIVFVFVAVRRRNRARNTNKEAVNWAIATSGVGHPDNFDPSKQQLPENPLYQAYRENDVVGYSACGNANQNLTEQLPDNPLYHSYQVNDDKENSKCEKNKFVLLPSQGEVASINTSENVSDSSAVYAQPNKIAKVSNSGQDESTKGKNETVYAQVSKPKK